MPKIIKNIRENLLAEARRQLAERGYAGMTVRSVADACGVGVGTVYNYFPSKDMLIAGFMSEDWRARLDVISSLPNDDPERLLGGIYGALRGFANDNQALFADKDAAKVSSVGFSVRHKMLREQIAEYVRPITASETADKADFAAEFISEALISWAMDDRDFCEVYRIIEKILK